ncbi:hypothetical protein BM221_010761 [Beauveria bassiana]|uniref:Uncharacterized protein n=1 Tax=Beauveria bassiana TaxID=176275 RepID=A0A2N6N806_BEABA|nr:hypothetical protein BM221_010761 [Beauveria bassiana]
MDIQLLCNECADIVSLLRLHNWRACLVCALAGEADDIDCADIQNFLDRPHLLGQVVSRKAQQKVACPTCRLPITLALVTAQSTFLVWEYVEVASRSGRGYIV